MFLLRVALRTYRPALGLHKVTPCTKWLHFPEWLHFEGEGGSPYYPIKTPYFYFQVVWLVRSGCSGSDEFDARAAEAKHEDCTRAARHRGMLWRTPRRPLLQHSGRARHFRPSLRGEACGCRRNKSSNFVFSLLVCRRMYVRTYVRSCNYVRT